MKKEDWIENVLDSAGKIKQAEADPFLFERILNRLQNKGTESNFVPNKIKARLTVGFAILIAINIFSIERFHSNKGETGHNESSFYNSYFSNYNYNY